jgi:nitroreductase
MDAYDAIVTRRSVVKPREGSVPDKATIERILEAGVRAPNHHLTQPWRFVVLAGGALHELAAAWIAGAERSGQTTRGVLEKCLRAPVIICVIEHPKTHLARVVEIEEHYATGAAIENILLAAHALGLAAMIRTGPAVGLPEVGAYLGVAEGELIAAFIYLGYPPDDDDRPLTRRTPADEKTQWRGFA